MVNNNAMVGEAKRQVSILGAPNVGSDIEIETQFV